MRATIAAALLVTAASTASLPIAVPCLVAGLALALLTGARK
jgi:ABC-type sulfate transport system permease component